ncbi:ABC transporter substrate-binding protein [Marispirochaeta aestuarii]|uniref:ABC transporter substrate-binding protein n=1 Tax=Marispirochaeta aestuarii TaxID=1963862 RepID=UPI001301F1C7|nr:ABC transporter substrate-binding protein [Marispirochaeta aestuarii]
MHSCRLFKSWPFRPALVLAALFLVSPFLIAGGASEKPLPDDSPADGFPVSVLDSFDRRVIISREPKRIVSLAPNITEILFALGEGDRLAGRSSWCDYPPGVENVPDAGSLMEPNIEKIASLRPDLIIASAHFQRGSLDKLDRLGVPVLILFGPESFDGLFYTIDKLAGLVDAEAAASRIKTDMRRRIEAVQEKTAGLARPKVYYVIDFGAGGDYTAGGNSFIHQLLTMAGARNIAEDLKGWAYSVEMVIQGDPDLIICPDIPGFRERLTASPGYRSLRAVREDRVFQIDVDLIDRQGPRLIDGLEVLAGIIHPEAFR